MYIKANTTCGSPVQKLKIILSIISIIYVDVFEALYCWTSVKGGAHTCFVDEWKSTKHIWALALTEVQQYVALNAAMHSKFEME